MYINHLQIYSKNLFDSLGGYREGFEGSQDHDLALRMSERLSPLHVETIAYHWRLLENTQSRSGEQFSQETTDHARIALLEHFSRLGIETTVEPVLFSRGMNATPKPIGVYRSRRILDVPSKVSIIIPCRLGTERVVSERRIRLLDNCLDSIRESLRSSLDHTEIVLVLNHDDDVSAAERLIAQ